MEKPDTIAARVLGSLIEKGVTTPDNYPLTLNALTSACNQTSNRDPVMALDEPTVMKGLDDLAARGLARGVLRSDSRVMRYRHLLEETLHLHAPEIAALGVLLLRGPQTPGEIRTRGARLFEFRDLPHVEVTLDSLASLDPPLVTQLPRQSGQKETRYVQLLAEQAETEARASASPARGGNDRMDALEQEVTALRAEVADLRAQLDEFRRQFQ